MMTERCLTTIIQKFKTQVVTVSNHNTFIAFPSYFPSPTSTSRFRQCHWNIHGYCKVSHSQYIQEGNRQSGCPYTLYFKTVIIHSKISPNDFPQVISNQNITLFQNWLKLVKPTISQKLINRFTNVDMFQIPNWKLFQIQYNSFQNWLKIG